jgi:hypothetical protein
MVLEKPISDDTLSDISEEEIMEIQNPLSYPPPIPIRIDSFQKKRKNCVIL